jgi:Na+/melibiose symporter-like transporter
VLVPLLFLFPFALASRYSITKAKHMLTREELDRRRAGVLVPPPDQAHLDLELAIAPPKATHI